MTRYKLLKSSISLEDFEGLLAFLVAEFEFDKNQAKPCWNLTRPRPENSGSGFFSGFSGFLDTQVCKTLSLKIIGIVHLDESDKTCTQLTCYNFVYLHWTFAFFQKKPLLDPLIGPLLDPLLDPLLNPLLDPFLRKHWSAKPLLGPL